MCSIAGKNYFFNHITVSSRGGFRKILRVRIFRNFSIFRNHNTPKFSKKNPVLEVIFKPLGDFPLYFVFGISALNHYDFLSRNWGFTAANLANPCIHPCALPFTLLLKKCRQQWSFHCHIISTRIFIFRVLWWPLVHHLY